MDHSQLFYTYLDECKRTYLSDVMSEKIGMKFQEYSISSLTFEKESYQNKLEEEWAEFRQKYYIDRNQAMHFVDYKKLILTETRLSGNPVYNVFVEDGKFSEDKLKEFFYDIRSILENNDFYIVHTDFVWDRKQYLRKRKLNEGLQWSKAKRNIAPNLLNQVPYTGFRKHLDSLMRTLIQKKVTDGVIVEDYYFDEILPQTTYTKLRFDADGKNFDARDDLKKAYNHTLTVGSDSVKGEVAVKLLDEIRFIRKEEVGDNHIPSHCGLEIVDFLCSMIASETRAEEYKKRGIIDEGGEAFKAGKFLNLEFSDVDSIEFYDLIRNDKLRRHTTNFLEY